MKVAIIGSGGREHAIAWKFAKSLGWENVYTLPGNGGIPNSFALDTQDFHAIKEFCLQNSIKLIFVGPEQALSEGIVNFFKGSDIKVFGPDKEASLLEASKIFAKQFMQKYDISTAGFKIYKYTDDALDYIAEKQGDVVIKFDGLAAGKGVFVCNNIAEAKEALLALENSYGKNLYFIVENKIVGSEISIIAFTDTKTIKTLQISQDHKQLLENDMGPNTGGMGAFSPIDVNEELMKKIQEKIISPTLKGIQDEKMNYHGIIYLGIMVENNSPYLLEYNVRFGDPETEVLLPALKTDLLDITNACLSEKLSDITFEFEDEYFVDVVLASGGYPKHYDKGFEITGINNLSDTNLVFHAGTKKIDDTLLTNGGRILNIVGRGKTLEQAIQNAYKDVEKVNFKEMYYRKDIGRRNNEELR